MLAIETGFSETETKFIQAVEACLKAFMKDEPFNGRIFTLVTDFSAKSFWDNRTDKKSSKIRCCCA